jgi:hypothetical protein
LIGQDHPTCNGSRYIEDVFTEIDSTLDIQYGSGFTIAGVEQDLFMNVFEPVGDTETARPVIVLAFGGSFIGGMREDMHFLCRAYARKGFVAVTIDYRLYDLPVIPFPTEEELKLVVTRAVADMKGAVRYLRADASEDNTFNIDPDFIFGGGISAGAIAAMHTAVLDLTDDLPEDLLEIIDNEGGLEGSVNDLSFSSELQGVINFSGGLNDANWIDENDPPFFSVHDDGDMVVPFGSGFATIFGQELIFLEGSQRCNEVADSVGVNNVLRVIEESDQHVSYFFNNPEEGRAAVDGSSIFLHNLLCKESIVSTNNNPLNTPEITIFPNPNSGLFNVNHSLSGNYDVIISNYLGQRVYQAPLNGPVDLRSSDRGFYILSVIDENRNLLVSKRLVVE